MFLFRDLKSCSVGGGPKRKMIQVTTIDHDHLPLREVNWDERWCTQQNEFKDYCEEVHNFEVRDDDVFVVTFGKSGTTWMQEIAWLLTHQLDFKRAYEENLSSRSIYFEHAALLPKKENNSFDRCKVQSSPRVIKTHLPMHLLPKQLWRKKSKTIFLTRNIRDVVVSFYHFMSGLSTWSGSLDEFVQYLINDQIYSTPFWDFIVEFWKLRHEPHIFFVTYEEMKRDLGGVIQKLCDFLERPKLNEEELKKLVEHVSFESMKKNRSTNMMDVLQMSEYELKEDFAFMRKGQVGSYKTELSEENQRLLSEWSHNCLAKYGLTEADIFGNF